MISAFQSFAACNTDSYSIHDWLRVLNLNDKLYIFFIGCERGKCKSLKQGRLCLPFCLIISFYISILER